MRQEKVGSMRRQLLISFSSTIAVLCIGLAFTGYYINLFGKEKYAVIALVLAIVSAIQNLDGLQKPLVNKYINAALSDTDLTSVIKPALCFSALVGLIAVGVFYICFGFVVDGLTSIEFTYISASGAFFLFLFFYSSPVSGYLIFKNQSHLNQVRKLVVFSTLYVFFFIFSYFYGDSLFLLVGLGFAGCAGFIYVFRVSGQSVVPSFDIRISINRNYRIFALGMGLNASVFLFLFIDKVFLYDLPAADMADYLIPSELLSKLAVIHGIFGGVLLGRIAQDAASSNGGFDVSTYFQSTIIYVGVIAIIGVNLSLYGRDFFEVWLGAEVNRQMMQVYYILVVSFVLNSFGWLGFNILLVDGRLRIATFIYMAMPCVLLLACYFLSDAFGIVGISISIAVARFLDVLLFFVSVRGHRYLVLGAIKKSWLPIRVLMIGLLLTIMFKVFMSMHIVSTGIYSLLLGVLAFITIFVFSYKFLLVNGYVIK